jgi:hypothetical protein
MGHVAGMGEVKTSYQVFGVLMQESDFLGGTHLSWNIKMDIKWSMKMWTGSVWLRVIVICVCLCRRQ